MKRRDFLESMLIAPVFLLSHRGRQAADAFVRLRPEDAGAVVNPHIYGHFIEHLGGVIYDGIWVGPGSKIPNIEGIRKQFIDDMKRIAAPNIRWPGGCFADGYHWRDGIGSVEQRPRTYNFWQSYMPEGIDATETNHFGTHEFLRLCELVNAEPYLAGNVTSGSPQELHDWVSYCNSPLGTVSLAEERKANGHPEPFRVRYWGIGNETWGCGGNFKPDEYATTYRRFATQFPKYAKPFLIAAGPNRDDFNWTRGFFGNIAPDRLHLVDGWALHYYTHHVRTNSPALDFTPDQWYRILHAGSGIEKVIENQWNVLGKFDKDHRIKFVIGEWGTWHLPGDEIDPSYLFGQIKTLRDALHAAVTLDIFHRHTEKIAMANISEAVNRQYPSTAPSIPLSRWESTPPEGNGSRNSSA